MHQVCRMPYSMKYKTDDFLNLNINSNMDNELKWKR